MNPQVSILIPCYNAERWVKQAIESALEQTYANKEVIVVDDGSTDQSLEIIKSFGDRIRWHSQPNSGGNAARNKLLELSSGEWLQYLDADDCLLPEKVARQVEFLAHNPQADVIYSLAIVEFLDGDRSYRTQRALPENPDPWVLLARWLLPQTGGMLWRKQVLIDVNGWKIDQPCCQEHELCSRLLMAGKQFVFFDDYATIYRIWSNTTISRKNQWESYRQRLLIKDRIEQHLQVIGALDRVRQDAINQARFECARIIYNYDRQWAASIIAQIRDRDSNFIPSGKAAPPIYRFIYWNLGFSQAEFFAKVKRLFTFKKSLKKS